MHPGSRRHPRRVAAALIGLLLVVAACSSPAASGAPGASAAPGSAAPSGISY